MNSLISILVSGSALAASATTAFPLFRDLRVGPETRSGSVTAEDAKRLERSCKTRRDPPPRDKFQEIDHNAARASCWALARIAQGRQARRQRFSASLQELTAADRLSSSLRRDPAPGESIEIRRDGMTVTVTVGPVLEGTIIGWVTRYHLLSRGDFTHRGEDEVMAIRETYATHATFSDCEMVILGLDASERVDIRAREFLGRCS